MMMNLKKALLFLSVIFVTGYAGAQNNVGIGTTTPARSAQLDIDSDTSGILIPRLTTTARLAINNPAEGLMVFDRTLRSFFFYSQSAWRQIGTSNSGVVLPMTTVSGTVTLGSQQYTVRSASSPTSIALPDPAANVGRIYRILNSSASNMQVNNYINFAGIQSTTLAGKSGLVVQSDGVRWYQIP